MFQFGNAFVSAFQDGLVFGGSASNIGWAMSTDGGTRWTKGLLPGMTANGVPAGTYGQVSDPAAAYRARADRRLIDWLIDHLPTSMVAGRTYLATFHLPMVVPAGGVTVSGGGQAATILTAPRPPVTPGESAVR